MRGLRKHEEYLEKIFQYCSAVEISVVYRLEPSDGVYMPSRRQIVLDKDLEPHEEVATLLHELGHAMDDSLTSGTPQYKKLERAYRVIYDKRPTKRQKELVHETEVRAWEYGKGIAKKLRIPLGKWYGAVRDEALLSYSEIQSR